MIAGLEGILYISWKYYLYYHVWLFVIFWFSDFVILAVVFLEISQHTQQESGDSMLLLKTTSSLTAKKLFSSILILWIPLVAQLDYEFIAWQRGCASASNTCLGFSTAIFHGAQRRATSLMLLWRLRQLQRETWRQLSVRFQAHWQCSSHLLCSYQELVRFGTFKIKTSLVKKTLLD